MDQNITERVMRVVGDQLGFEMDKLTPETSFVQDLGADSLDIVELVMALEEEFQITIPEEANDDVQTIGDAVRHIESELNKNA
ncbi:MAG: acyl carrier protein [Planctomycetaceae bacterium]|nr:acyl carrier protein [Planctomycetaceae bacterium]